MRVLIVDDEPMILRMMKNYLEDRGVEVEVASSGADALRAVEEKDFDAAIVDVRLPDMDGDSLIIRAAKVRPHTAYFVHTGSIDYAPSRELAALGIDEGSIIRKPVRNMEDIRALLEERVARR